MSILHGRSHAITPFRRLVIDLMHFSKKVPTFTLERRMNLAEVVAARRACQCRPNWTAIFIKAFGIVAARYPELRFSYMTFPWPRLYEHAHSIATMVIDREVDGEKMVLYGHIPRPEQLSLRQISNLIHGYQERPVRQINSFVRAMRLTRVPWPLRRWVWWAALNVLGGERCRNFGTFGITTVAGEGAGMLTLTPLLTSTVYYGLLDDAGSIDMRLVLDHRVLDGVAAARALADLEGVLREEILRELCGLKSLAVEAESAPATLPFPVAPPDSSPAQPLPAGIETVAAQLLVELEKA